jgi:hypothetical protein
LKHPTQHLKEHPHLVFLPEIKIGEQIVYMTIDNHKKKKKKNLFWLLATNVFLAKYFKVQMSSKLQLCSISKLALILC